MKLQTKLLLTLLAGVLLVTVASQLLQRTRNTATIAALAKTNLAIEERAQWGWVENLQRAVQASLLDAMAQGDMDKFSQLLQSQKEVKGLQEMTLYNLDGIATYSTSTNRLRQKVPAEFAERLLVKSEPVKRRTEDSFELYRPSVVDKSCVECHNEFKLGATGGIMAMRYSTESLKEASNQWNGLVGTVSRESLWNMVITTALLCLVTAGMIALAVRRQIAAPLGRVTGFLNASSAQITEASASVASASSSLAEQASHQAASLEETSASLEEMASMARSNAEHAARVDALAREAAATTEAGMKDMQALADAMQSIQASGTEVAKIVRTIDEIAFQTNILALNAAVEAARAGEAGMGFAVVADEVRNLAQRSAKAAKETAAQIEASVSRGDAGALLSEQVRIKLVSILDQVKQVNALATEVASACREQDQGVQQINQAIGEMDRATQSAATGAEESATAAEQLKAQADELVHTIRDLHELVHGGGSGSSGGAAPKVGNVQRAAKPAQLKGSGQARSGAGAGKGGTEGSKAGFKSPAAAQDRSTTIVRA